MRRIWISAVFLAAITAASESTLTAQTSAPPATVTVVHLNDIYEIQPVQGGKSGGPARVATIFSQLRAAHAALMTTLGGDYLSPSALGTARIDGKPLAGRQMVDVLNVMGLEWATFGNHEFDVSEDAFRAHLTDAKFRIVSTNVTAADGKPFPGVPTSAIVPFTSAGRTVKIGLIAVTIDSTKKNYVRYRDPIASAREEVAKLRGQVDAIVALTHVRLVDDVDLVNAVPEIDVVLGGHEHENWLLNRGPRLVPIIKADANVRTLAVVTMTFGAQGTRPTVSSRLQVIDDTIASDPAVETAATRWTKLGFDAFRRDGFLPEAVVATATEPLDGLESTVRNRPGRLTDLVAASLAHEVKNADVALLNGGSIRIDDVVPAGPITEYDIIRILPFGGKVLSATFEGALLARVIETGVNNQGLGGYLHAWGVRSENGILLVQGKPLDPKARYRVAMTDFLLTGGEVNLGYLTRTNPQVSDIEEFRDIRRAVIEELKAAYPGTPEKSTAPDKPGTPPAAEPKPATPSARKPTTTPAQKPAEPVRQMTSDMKAYQEATKVADPDKKIEALRNVIADFPKGSTVAMAERQILGTLVKKASDSVKAVQEQARKVAETEGEPGRNNASSAASALLNANLLLEDAERYAVKAVAALDDERKYVEAQKKSFAERQAEAAQKDPTAKPMTSQEDSVYVDGFKSSRQSALVTLGQIYDKRGKPSEAEKVFKEAFALPTKGSGSATAALRLAEFAKKAGRDTDQFEYLTAVASAGRMKLPERAEYEALYKKQHSGSIDGLDEMLDARYAKQNPMPVHVTPYQRTKNRTNRVVLGEVFTGAGCPPCVGADYAFDGALERYKTSELAVLMYHQHIPQPDPLTNPSTLKRAEFYALRGVPTSAIDGEAIVGGGNAGAAPKIFKETIDPVIEKRLTMKPGAKIDVRAVLAGGKVNVVAAVAKTGKVAKTAEGKTEARTLRLHVVLAEERVRYSGENGVRFHPMVVRSVAKIGKDTLGFPLEAGKPFKLDYVFDLATVVEEAKAHLDDFEVTSTRFGTFQFMAKKHEIDAATLSVVAFVQEENSKEILQSALVRVK